MLNEEIYERARDGGGRVEEKGWNPQDGTIKLLQTQEEVVSVLDGQQVVVVFLQNAGIEGGEVGPAAHVFTEDLGGREVAAEDEVVLVDVGTAAAAGENPAVADDGAGVVALVDDGRRVWKQRPEVFPDGEDVFVTGVVVVHQLTHAHAAFGQGEVVRHVDVLSDFFTGTQKTKPTSQH